MAEEDRAVPEEDGEIAHTDHEVPVSQRGQVEPFRVMGMLSAAVKRQEEHGDAIMLCVGQPSTGAPTVVREAAVAAIASQNLGYTDTLGTDQLRAEIARWHSQTYGVRTTADNVVVTTGSSGAFLAVFAALLDQGGTVALASPGYPAYRNVLQALGNRVIDVPCGADTRFQLTRAQLEELAARGEKPDLVLVTSPGNPTGTIIDPGELEAIATWCEQTGTAFVSDEIYHGISFGPATATARQFSDKAIVIGSASKYFSMTGWRLGWLIIPDDPGLRNTLDNLLANMALCPPAVSQAAMMPAFGAAAAAELTEHVERYQRNRDLLVSELPRIGLPRFAPADGAFYLWIDVSDYTDDSEAFCHDLLAATGVALAPGTDFDGSADKAMGKHHVRLSFAGTTAETAEACHRMQEYLAELK